MLCELSDKFQGHYCVNYKIAKDFTDTVKTKAIGQNVLTSISPGQLLVKIMQDELALLMGGSVSDVNLKSNPSVILIAGLQGSGKTTFSAKLANYLRSKRKKRPLLVAGDVYRPAAVEQLSSCSACNMNKTYNALTSFG